MHKLLLSSVAVGLLAFTTGAHAVAYSSPASISLIDFGNSASAGLVTTTSPGTIGGETFTFTTSGTPQTGIYSGTTPNVSVSPFGAGSTKNYLAVEPGGSITITFAAAQTAFALLWGSVDTYNSLTFIAGSNTVIGGADVASALGFSPNGTVNQNVLIAGLTAFNTLTVTSTTAAFEFAPGTPVPEPVSLALLGTGLVGLGLVRRLRPGNATA